jgi:hypothetical protein
MTEATTLVGTCAIVIPTVMSELDSVLLGKPEEAEKHIGQAKELLQGLLEQTRKAVAKGHCG